MAYNLQVSKSVVEKQVKHLALSLLDTEEGIPDAAYMALLQLCLTLGVSAGTKGLEEITGRVVDETDGHVYFK